MLRARTIALALAASAALTCGSAAFAAEEAAHGLGVTVGVTGGTLGLGPEVGYRIGGHLGLRAGAGFFSYNKDGDEDDYTYEGKVKLKSLGLMADIYPFSGSFRVSIGARNNKNHVNAVVAPTTNIEIGNQTYTPAQAGTLSGEVKFKKFSPTATIGWGGDFGSGLHFGIDVGLMMQGSPNVDVTSTSALYTDQSAAGQQFRAQLAQEVADAEDDAKDYKFWPVIQLHLSYSF